MFKSIVFASLSLLCNTVFAGQSDLTDAESRWLRAAAPVIDYARQIKLPLDIIVQPQQAPDAVPLALGFAGGRCKLVLSMRGNPQADTILQTVPAAQRDWMIEAMTAHEIGHCWRYAQGDWHQTPSGFVEAPERYAYRPDLQKVAQEIRETRREEGFADLVALAWTRDHHPEQYGAVYAWMEDVRRTQPLAGASHDTLAWLGLVKDGAVFTVSDSPFDQVQDLWREGLIKDK